MAARFFGQFLLERGVVGAEALLRAIDYQNKHNLRLGELAVKEGFITEAEADQINREQRRRDAPFGAVAVDLGFITQKQLERLILRQKQAHVFIGEALVAVKALPREVLESELALYRKEQEEDQAQISSARSTILWARGPVYSAFTQVTAKLLRRIAGLVTKEGVLWEANGLLPPAEVQVAIPFSGGWSGLFVLRMTQEVAELVACRMLGEPSPPEELLGDAIKEFANVVCGQICATLAGDGLGCELAAPRDLLPGDTATLAGHKIVVFPLDAAEGSVEVAAAVLR